MADPSISSPKDGISQNRLHHMTGFALATIKRRLADAGLAPVGKARTHPVFPIGEALRILYAAEFSVKSQAEPEKDPSKMNGADRKEFYQAEKLRLEVEKEMGHLIPDAEVEREMALLVQGFTKFLDILPDVLDRDVGLKPEQIDKLNELITAQREKLFEDITAGVGEEEEPEEE